MWGKDSVASYPFYDSKAMTTFTESGDACQSHVDWCLWSLAFKIV